MDEEVIQQNVKGLFENLERVFTNHAMYLWNDNRELKDVKYEHVYLSFIKI